MNLFSHHTVSELVPVNDCHATLARLISNISGFAYRRRHDARWTMEFVSAGCRDITGYDPHRFIANQSLAFADLIARADWKRVNAQARAAAQLGRRMTLDYFIRAAHGTWIHVEDRFTPVVEADGKVRVIEGVIDRARSPARRDPRALRDTGVQLQANLHYTAHLSNSAS